MWRNNRKLLISLIVFFVLINLVFFAYILGSNKDLFTRKAPSTTSAPAAQSDPNIGEFSVRQGDLSQIILGGLTIFGYVESPPVKEESGNETFILSIPLKSGESFKSKILLGKAADKISHTIMKDTTLASQDRVTWTFESAENLLGNFVKGRPITLELVYQESLEGLSQNCDEVCEQVVANKILLFENNSRILDALKNNIPLKEVIEIGPVQSVAFYVK